MSLFEFSLKRIETLLVTIMKKLDILIMEKALKKPEVALFALCTVWRVLEQFRSLSLKHIPTELATIALDLGKSTSRFIKRIQKNGNNWIQAIAPSNEDLTILATRIVPDFSVSPVHVSYRIRSLKFTADEVLERSKVEKLLESPLVSCLPDLCSKIPESIGTNNAQPLFASLMSNTSVLEMNCQQEWILRSNHTLGRKIEDWILQAGRNYGLSSDQLDTGAVLQETFGEVKFVVRWDAKDNFGITRTYTIDRPGSVPYGSLGNPSIRTSRSSMIRPFFDSSSSAVSSESRPRKRKLKFHAMVLSYQTK
ncbi:hypothetical protein MMC11_009162 [Xylographa trunciseda]|nr:hypothetical protein [Xylographa trunciseda]